MGPAVLVVDDAATVRLYYRQILGGMGCAVEEAWNGAEGLEKALVRPPQLILLDVNMPVLDGYSTLRALRREPSLCAIPTIMITTEAGGGQAERAYAAGANLYLQKPVRPERLTNFTRVLLGMQPA
ncbi:response regulator [Paracraurococcus lichenis]|uniref:Response regulator n=1 Tax=Paracraurococcus lichenis TaxID=3064888 RepID=A0ABT9E6C9_9PROT|nr:response regulator [Paracraurococcus sp. LOR1-02]MDO9711691.1 response regulator [Paracraurococcus sp. LOR1-02]